MARIAFILADDFEDAEFRVPYDRVKQAGHEAVIIGLEAGEPVKGKKGEEVITPEKAVRNVSSREFDALVIPGGYSPDHLRMDIDMVGFVRDFFRADKPLAAICHAPWMFVEADIADGRTLTSWPSLKTDLINAGARWVDREVVEDGNVITSRNPGDLLAFSEALLRQVDHGIARRLEAPLAPEAASEQPPTMH
ncbi:type 1 glutamine amidotransferase [Myxococcus sp. XM-1-1-1]|uniref:type 1 glutamine amidotransferase domain-containing protein n=1 Tax=Myxococcus sp. XM-1-1-1 TaxID=2874602 RepID=UPI001CC1B9A6|nr:type 1 glutamine amidotransferase domain-containing protein [Myxococcus sp. XM-1-1-1]MBZ4411891.1 type 1 glutamine amidotransferase [Myxococcus sp. XM-1-1-1]BDT37913.1 type 1 glutamine amidotransferase [Myxococcus sp. MH1]